MKALLLIGILTLGLAGRAAAQDASALLVEVDARRSIPDMDFELVITSYQGQDVLDANTLWGWVKATSEGNKTLLAFAEPASVRGRKMLMDGPTVYLLFPRTRNPIRLSPLQVLLGQSSNGDVARTGFAQEYDAKGLTTEDVDSTPCWVFDLAAKADHQGSSYRRVKLWVEKAGLKPVAADFYSSSDKVLKHAVYADWRPVGDKQLSYRLEITDGTDASLHTVLQYTRVGRQAFPDSAFRRDYLEGWVPGVPK